MNQVELSWTAAEAACEAFGAGTHLLVVDDAAEQSIASASLGPASDGWIGGSDRVAESSYLTVTGDPWPAIIWGPNEPNGDAQDCLRTFQDGSLGDRLCTDINDYLCEYDGRAPVTSAF